MLSKLQAPCILIFALLCACSPPPANKTVGTGDVTIESLGFHESLITVDTHIDIPPTFGEGDADPGKDGPMQVDLPKMAEGGLDVGFFIVYVGQGAMTIEGYKSAYDKAIKKFNAIKHMTENYPEKIGLATNVADLNVLMKQKHKAAVIGVENGYPLGEKGEHLEEFYRRGARYISLTHFGNNQFADSSGPRGPYDGVGEPIHDGLSDLGKDLIARMNDLGIMVDVSHTGAKSTLQAVEVSRAPVIASHSALRSLHDIPRNISDAEIKAIAAKGGVVQIVAFDTYLKAPPPGKSELIKEIRKNLGFDSFESFATASELDKKAMRAEIRNLDEKMPRASISTLLDHIDYAVELVGIDYVGIASDFNGGGGIIGWNDASETAKVTEALIQRGYSEQDIAQLWGGNLLRVWSDVEKFAAL